MLVEIFVAIIVVQLLAIFNVSFCKDINSFVAYIHFAVRPAGVINVACFVPPDIAVYHRVFTRPEKVFPSIEILLLFRNGSSCIFDNACASWNVLFGEEPETGARTLHPKCIYC